MSAHTGSARRQAEQARRAEPPQPAADEHRTRAGAYSRAIEHIHLGNARIRATCAPTFQELNQFLGMGMPDKSTIANCFRHPLPAHCLPAYSDMDAGISKRRRRCVERAPDDFAGPSHVVG
jgi:hypothetical protein